MDMLLRAKEGRVILFAKAMRSYFMGGFTQAAPPSAAHGENFAK
jgi:hypothetical protein